VADHTANLRSLISESLSQEKLRSRLELNCNEQLKPLQNTIKPSHGLGMMRSSVSLIAVTLGTASVALVEHFLLQIQRAVLMDPNFNTTFYLQKISKHQERQFLAKFFTQELDFREQNHRFINISGLREGRAAHQRRLLLPALPWTPAGDMIFYTRDGVSS